MRYVPTDDLTEGMVLGKPLYGHRGELMLERDMTLTRDMIKRIKQLQYSGLYAKDDFSEGLEIRDVVSDEVRYKMVTSMRSLMVDAGAEKRVRLQNNMLNISQYLEQLVEEIMSSDSIVFNIIDIKQFDLYTYQHSVNVCILCCILGKIYNMPREQLLRLAWAAVLHDVGKVFIDKAILNKPGNLTTEEFDVMKTHPRQGSEWIKKSGLPYTVVAAVLQHHEKFNGGGYPSGRKENDILLFARIIAVADVYDAITSNRPYREPILPSEAYEYILGNSGQAFHPEVVEVFVKKVAPFPLGVQVQLSNGIKGIVFKNYEDCLTRPLIKVRPEPGQPTEEDVFIDLKNDVDAYSVTIQKVLM